MKIEDLKIGEFYRNKSNKEKYEVLGFPADCNNHSCYTDIAVHYKNDKGDYVRNREEFLEKFDLWQEEPEYLTADGFKVTGETQVYFIAYDRVFGFKFVRCKLSEILYLHKSETLYLFLHLAIKEAQRLADNEVKDFKRKLQHSIESSYKQVKQQEHSS